MSWMLNFLSTCFQITLESIAPIFKLYNPPGLGIDVHLVGVYNVWSIILHDDWFLISSGLNNENWTFFNFMFEWYS